jgi:hypothetical protein
MKSFEAYFTNDFFLGILKFRSVGGIAKRFSSLCYEVFVSRKNTAWKKLVIMDYYMGSGLRCMLFLFQKYPQLIDTTHLSILQYLFQLSNFSRCFSCIYKIKIKLTEIN